MRKLQIMRNEIRIWLEIKTDSPTKNRYLKMSFFQKSFDHSMLKVKFPPNKETIDNL